MNNLLQRDYPFYTAYTKEKNIIDSAIDKAIHESAEKIGKDLVCELFPINTNRLVHKKVA